MSEREHLHVSCLIDYLRNTTNPEIEKATDALIVSTSMNENDNPEPIAIIQYTHGIGGMAKAFSDRNKKAFVLFDSEEAFDFTKELLSDCKDSINNLILVEEPIDITSLSFPLCPNGKGWDVVILDDIVQHLGADVEMTALFRAIASTMSSGGKLIVRIAQPKQESWNKEYNSTVVAEAIKKIGMRRFNRTITSHGALKLRHEENIYSFDASDIHDCARNSSFRPTRELGLDYTKWCSYEKI